MKERNWLRYAGFGSLYFTQGTILGYFTSLNALYFEANGRDIATVGFFSAIAMLPFVIKIFMAMLSDKVSLFKLGHRKPYIVVGLAVQIICLILVPLINLRTSLGLFIFTAFMLQMGMALYDTCTDGLALDTTPDGEEGIIQGFMVGGRALGVIAASALAGFLAETFSWAAVFWALAILTLVPVPFLFILKENKAVHEREFNWSAFSAFKQKKIIGVMALGFIVFFVIIGINMLVNPYLEDRLAISLTQAGLYGSIWGIGVVAGSFVAAFLSRVFGDKNAVRIGLLLSSFAILLLIMAVNSILAWGLVFIFGLSYGTQQTIYFAIAMENTEETIAASMYSILMAVTNVAQGVGMAVCGLLSDSTGYFPTFIIIAVLNLGAFLFLPMIFKDHGEEPSQAAFA